MSKATEIFTPNGVPSVTYVSRSTLGLEKRLRDAFLVPNMVVSISGPSKSGKTVLVNKVVAEEHLITVSGASITSPEKLWDSVLDWMGAPSQVMKKSETSLQGQVGGKGSGKVGIPYIAEGQIEGHTTAGAGQKWGNDEVFVRGGLQQVEREIAGSEYTVFIDDFHYINRPTQVELGKQIKEAAEKGIRICTASVPHRSDDVVRSNPELRGRVFAIDIGRWSSTEIQQIADRGFRELGVDLSPQVIAMLVREAFGSPQLMQSICLNMCFEEEIYETLPEHKRVDITGEKISHILERTSTSTDFSRMLSTLHSGPKERGTERRVYEFTDGTSGDVYRCALLAIRADPPALSFSYDEILARSASVCRGMSPQGSSLQSTLGHMSRLAKVVQPDPVIEWDQDILDIVEPYFLFFLRCSSHLQQIANQ